MRGSDSILCRNPFTTINPRAAIALKQGIRPVDSQRGDRGVLVLLDNRITKRRYGQVFSTACPITVTTNWRT
jgi:ATP-dependent DNA helicase DinG